MLKGPDREGAWKAGKSAADMTDLGIAFMIVLALNHPVPVDALDVFEVLWQVERIPATSMAEAIKLLVITMSAVEQCRYAYSKDEHGKIFYALTPEGAALFR
jgi:hypothetical protein